MMVGWFGSVRLIVLYFVLFVVFIFFLSKSYSLHKSGVGKICERLESTRSDNLFTWYSHSGRRTDRQTKEHRHRRTDKHTVWSPDELCSSSKEVLNVVIVVVIANLIFSLKMSLTILDIKYFVVVWSFVFFLFRFFLRINAYRRSSLSSHTSSFHGHIKSFSYVCMVLCTYVCLCDGMNKKKKPHSKEFVMTMKKGMASFVKFIWFVANCCSCSCCFSLRGCSCRECHTS